MYLERVTFARHHTAFPMISSLLDTPSKTRGFVCLFASNLLGHPIFEASIIGEVRKSYRPVSPLQGTTDQYTFRSLMWLGEKPGLRIASWGKVEQRLPTNIADKLTSNVGKEMHISLFLSLPTGPRLCSP